MMEKHRFEYVNNWRHYLHELIKEDDQYRYMRNVYDYLEMLEPGSRMVISTDEQHMKMLLVCVGVFMDSGLHWLEFELNDDYTKIRRKRWPPELLRKEQNKCIEQMISSENSNADELHLL